MKLYLLVAILLASYQCGGFPNGWTCRQDSQCNSGTCRGGGNSNGLCALAENTLENVDLIQNEEASSGFGGVYLILAFVFGMSLGSMAMKFSNIRCYTKMADIHCELETGNFIRNY